MAARLVLAALAAGARAQDWGTTGAWEMVIPVPATAGAAIASPPRAYHHATSVPGSFVLAGNDTSITPQGTPALYVFNIVLNQWAKPQYANVPSSVTAPFLFANGGSLVLVDELVPNVLWTTDSSAPTPNAWAMISTSGAPQLRRGQRFLNWGSTLYMFGGVTGVVPGVTQANDLYALDLTSSIINPGAPASWIPVSPPAVPVNGINVVPGYPPPRVGYSWTGYQVGSIMYGGISTDTAGGDPFACIFSQPGTPKDTGCHFHQNVWAFLPGMGDPKTPYSSSAAGGMPSTSWVRLGENGANGGPVPAGRVEHSAGSMGDQLYVYGGVTATGISNELWAYNLVSQTWQQVTPSSPSPPTTAPGGTGFAWSVGTVVGRHFYIYQQSFSRGAPTANSGALWRWAPSSGGPPSSSNSGYSTAIANGHTAGIVLGLLLGIANLYFLVLLARNADVMPACGPVGAWCSAMCGGVSARAKGVTGFYSSSASGAAASSSSGAGGYMAPSSGGEL